MHRYFTMQYCTQTSQSDTSLFTAVLHALLANSMLDRFRSPSHWSPSRVPVCSEDEAAHRSLLSQGVPSSASPYWCAANVPISQPQSSPYALYLSTGKNAPSGSAAARRTPSAASHPTSSLLGSRNLAVPAASSPPAFGSRALPSISPWQRSAPAAATPPLKPLPRVQSDEGNRRINIGSVDADAPDASAAADMADADKREDGVSGTPWRTLRLLCCYSLLLLAGLAVGMVAHELKWVDLGQARSPLHRLEQWLHSPREDPVHGGDTCADGLMIAGPARTGVSAASAATALCPCLGAATLRAAMCVLRCACCGGVACAAVCPSPWCLSAMRPLVLLSSVCLSLAAWLTGEHAAVPGPADVDVLGRGDRGGHLHVGDRADHVG